MTIESLARASRFGFPINASIEVQCDLDGFRQVVYLSFIPAVSIPRSGLVLSYSTLTCPGCGRRRQVDLVVDDEGMAVVRAGEWTKAPFRGLSVANGQRTKRKWWWRRAKQEPCWDD